LLRLVGAELRKIATLPSSWIAVGVAAVGSLGITLLNSSTVRGAVEKGQLDAVAYTTPAEAVFSAAPIGTVGAVVLGVVAISSEYTANSTGAGAGRQIAATLTTAPNRLAVLGAKVLATVLSVVGMAVIAVPTSLVAAYLAFGEPIASTDLADTAARSGGVAIYWTLTALMALAVTAVTRSGIVPLIVFIVNSSLVSVSFLLTRLTWLAYYLPDAAGIRLFGRDTLGLFDRALDPLTGGLVMAAWTLTLLAASAAVLTCRDA
jgi:ABC-type transport system involved in multi-copper enzyme maturation permease subunit